MPTRRSLKGIASGLSGKLNSRNNDISGHWGIGYLYNEMINQKRKECEFDILNGVSTPYLCFSAKFTKKYKQYLLKQLEKNCLPETVILKAVFKIEFDIKDIMVERPNGPYYGPGFASAGMASWGQPYKSEVIITSDLGKEYSITHFSQCYNLEINDVPLVFRQ